MSEANQWLPWLVMRLIEITVLLPMICICAKKVDSHKSTNKSTATSSSTSNRKDQPVEDSGRKSQKPVIETQVKEKTPERSVEKNRTKKSRNKSKEREVEKRSKERSNERRSKERVTEKEQPRPPPEIDLKAAKKEVPIPARSSHEEASDDKPKEKPKEKLRKKPTPGPQHLPTEANYPETHPTTATSASRLMNTETKPEEIGESTAKASAKIKKIRQGEMCDEAKYPTMQDVNSDWGENAPAEDEEKTKNAKPLAPVDKMKQINQGVQRNSCSYPTMGDIRSDWGENLDNSKKTVDPANV